MIRIWGKGLSHRPRMTTSHRRLVTCWYETHLALLHWGSTANMGQGNRLYGTLNTAVQHNLRYITFGDLHLAPFHIKSRD